MNYTARLLLESYKEHIADESYIKEVEEKLKKHNCKMDTLLMLFNADMRIRKSFARKIGVPIEELLVFMDVLREV